jgi:O-antigen/teichoic acid export membrane protein
MMRRQIVFNALTTFAQVIGSAATLFFLYRFLIRTIGLECLGIWSLVLATTSVVTLANQGFSTSIVKHVAKYTARGRVQDVSLLMQTAVIFVGLALAVVSVCLYPGARWILETVLPRRSLAEALAILPLALLSLWLNVLEGILQAGLAGLQRITVCNYLEFGGSLSYLLLAWTFVPRHGLLGLACAQAIQSAAILLITWFLLRQRIRHLPPVPHRWSRPLFDELAAYGFHFQLITASQALREPVTKALLTKFGGLALTGFYDLAARCVFTIRELLVQSNQVLVPTISHLRECDADSIPAVYRESYRLIFFLAVPAFTSLAILSPLISRIWIGRYESVFVEFVCILCAGWLVNVLANPSYVVDLGTGALRWVSLGCICTVILSAVLGFLAGWRIGGPAVVAATAFSLATGYLVVLIAYHLENRVSFSQLLPKESGAILSTSAIGALVFLPLFCAASVRAAFSLPVTAGAISALMALILIPMFFHPMRKQLLRWVFSRVPA